MTAATRILRASWVLPIVGPALPNGEVVIEGDRIVEVRHAGSAGASEAEDFGAAIILPGLVNVHTHLDYTVMRGLLEDIDFFSWIRELTARAAAFSPEDWNASAMWGAAEALAGGVTTIGDCTFSGAAFYAAKAFGLGGAIYQEVFGIDERQTVEEIIQELRDKVGRLQADSVGTRLEIGISPHAPYTVRPTLFKALAALAETEKLPICIHAAESRAEAELLRQGDGEFARMYERRGISWQIPGGSTVAYLESLGMLGPRTLLVHGVQLHATDRPTIHRHDTAWAHCPKSNAKLGNGVAPLGLLGNYPRHNRTEAAGERFVRVGLGSDSVASNNTMDMFEEMRFAVLMQRGARHQIETLGAHDAVQMATRGGAQALDLGDEIGSLKPGMRADLCVVGLNSLHSTPVYDPYNALVYAASASDVLCTFAAGQVRYDARLGTGPADRFPQNDIEPLRARMHAAAQKMRDWRPAKP